MSADLRRGACPALDAPMQTGDGLLIRLSPASRAFSPNDLIRLCESALANGNGIVEITARGSVQFRGLSEASATRFAEDVYTAGITVRTGVPVEIGPLAGLDPDEIADSHPLADEIRKRIAETGLASRLGPKVSVVVDGGGRFGLDTVSADIRLDAVRERDTPDGLAVRWRIALAGDGNSAYPIGVLEHCEAADVAVRILSQITELGSFARTRDILNGEKDRRPSEIPVLRERADAKRTAPNPGIEIGHPHPLTDNRVALTVALTFNQIDARDLIRLADEASALGITEFRPAPLHRLILICEPDSSVDALLRAAAACSLLIDPADPRLAIDACTGAPGCASGHFQTKSVATAIADLLSRDPAITPPTIHVSGCAKGCARQKPAALTLVGGENGVGLVANGTARGTPSTYTTPDKAGELAVEHMRAMRGIGETRKGQASVVRTPTRMPPAGRKPPMEGSPPL